MMLQILRLERGLTQAALAEKTGIPVKTIQNYETGSRNINGAKLSTLVTLAAALDCPIVELLTDEDLKLQCESVNLS